MNTKKRFRKVDYVQVYNEFLNEPQLSLKAKGLFSYMLSKPDTWSFSLKSIGSQSKDGVDSIRSAMNELKELGFVSYQKKPDGSGIYYLDEKPKLENPNLENPNMGKSNCISNTSLNSNTSLSFKEQQMNLEDILPIETKKENHTKEIESVVAEVWPTFEDFWEKYDLKENRKDAEKKWSKLKQGEKEKIMLHLELYVPSTPDKQYRKRPVTYLNQRAWENEVIFKKDRNEKSNDFRKSILGY